jgi:hypothetical protein
MSAAHDPPGGSLGGKAGAPPLLELLERLGRSALAAGVRAGPLSLAGVEPQPDGAMLLFALRGMGGLLNTTVRVKLTILEVGEQKTRCAVSLPDAGGLGRLLGGGLGKLPRPLLEQALSRIVGDAVTLDGDGIVLDHARLLARLRGRK